MNIIIGGEIYIYFTKEKTQIDDWKVDGFKWRNNGGLKSSAP